MLRSKVEWQKAILAAKNHYANDKHQAKIEMTKLKDQARKEYPKDFRMLRSKVEWQKAILAAKNHYANDKHQQKIEMTKLKDQARKEYPKDFRRLCRSAACKNAQAKAAAAAKKKAVAAKVLHDY